MENRREHSLITLGGFQSEFRLHFQIQRVVGDEVGQVAVLGLAPKRFGGGIAALATTLSLIPLALLNRNPRDAQASGALSASGLVLICPRCHLQQTLGFGQSNCRQCDLRFAIEVTEPRCPACQYLLFGLTSSQCPECGAEVGKAKGEPAGAA